MIIYRIETFKKAENVLGYFKGPRFFMREFGVDIVRAFSLDCLSYAEVMFSAIGEPGGDTRHAMFPLPHGLADHGCDVIEMEPIVTVEVPGFHVLAVSVEAVQPCRLDTFAINVLTGIDAGMQAQVVRTTDGHNEVLQRGPVALVRPYTV